MTSVPFRLYLAALVFNSTYFDKAVFFYEIKDCLQGRYIYIFK